MCGTDMFSSALRGAPILQKRTIYGTLLLWAAIVRGARQGGLAENLWPHKPFHDADHLVAAWPRITKEPA